MDPTDKTMRATRRDQAAALSRDSRMLELHCLIAIYASHQVEQGLLAWSLRKGQQSIEAGFLMAYPGVGSIWKSMLAKSWSDNQNDWAITPTFRPR